MERRRVATPRGDYDATIEAMARLVEEIEAAAGRAPIGVCIPGTISPATGLVKNANSTWLNGRALGEDFAARAGRPARFANDANCFALSEATDGAASGAACVFGVILGTGCGGGVVDRGEALRGANAIAGEWGHNPLPWPEEDELPGPACWCGRVGCLETWLSGPALSADLARVSGVRLSPEEIVSAAEGGDAAADVALGRYERRLARGLASVINLLDPDVIVLGGGLSRIGRLYDAVPRLWSQWVFSDRVDTRLVAPVHGDASGVRGAARLWP